MNRVIFILPAVMQVFDQRQKELATELEQRRVGSDTLDCDQETSA